MKIKYFLAAVALALPAMLHAVPADPRVRTMTNPDGTVVQFRMLGDEHFHFMTDVDRTMILERDAHGFLTEAKRDGKILLFNEDTVDMLREEQEAKLPAYQGSGVAGPMKMAALDSEGRSTYPTVGAGNRSLVVLVEFRDVRFSMENPKEYFTRQLNEPGFSDYWGKGSALDYYIDNSNGLYKPQFDVIGPVQIPYDASYFGNSTSNVTMATLIKTSLTTLHDAGEVDFRNYDLDEDGTVDTVFFYYAGYGAADSETETIWPHQANYQDYVNYYGRPQLRLDGKKIGPYACANELKGYNPQTRKYPYKDGSTPWVDGIGTFVHEYGHVLGLPDLYEVNYAGITQTPGDWDVMDAGCYNSYGCLPPHYSAYEQWVCKWLELEEAESGTHYEIPALGTENARAVRISVPKTLGSVNKAEFFVIEARDKSSWDSCFDAGGIMIWHIDYDKSVWTSDHVNFGGTEHVSIIYAKNELHPLFTSGNIYPGGEFELVPSTNNSRWESPFVTSLAYDANTKTGSFDFNVVTEMPSGAPVLHDQPVAAADGKRNVILKWDAMEGADSYQLTVKRVSDNVFYTDYNEKNVGNVTEFTVESLPLAYWGKEMSVYVRAVVGGFPSQDISNVITFIPKDLPKGSSAVGSILGDDIAVYGSNGCVMAPEGAEIYDISGRRMENSGLPAGIYIAKVAGRTVKVMVK